LSVGASVGSISSTGVRGGKLFLVGGSGLPEGFLSGTSDGYLFGLCRAASWSSDGFGLCSCDLHSVKATQIAIKAIAKINLFIFDI
jgi:hypothetical protein